MSVNKTAMVSKPRGCEMKEYKVKIKVLNNVLLEVMKTANLITAADLSRFCGISQVEAGYMINLKESGYTKDGMPRAYVKKVAKALKVLPEMLYPDEHLRKALREDVYFFDVAFAEINALYSDKAKRRYLQTEALYSALDDLSEEDKDVIMYRFGLDCENPMTTTDIAAKLNLSGFQVRRRERDAMLKLKQKLSNV